MRGLCLLGLYRSGHVTVTLVSGRLASQLMGIHRRAEGAYLYFSARELMFAVAASLSLLVLLMQEQESKGVTGLRSIPLEEPRPASPGISTYREATWPV